MDPPPCVQNAMMTKDKKPFTYTPGGIDLSEIRSPRMARRIERNANYEGVTDVPQQQPQQQQLPQNLPPSTLAAMNPQIQVQVLPSIPAGGPQLNRQGAVPPPPPPPPPAAPPSSSAAPLPTQKVNNNANQIIERPDMTKIIPDNPMALLKKTGGPNQRTTFIDEMYATGSVKTPPVNTQVNRQPDFQQPQIQTKQQPTSPTNNYSQIEQQKPAPFNLGSLYIAPINQQQQQPIENQAISPPIPPERQETIRIQSPGTPTLKEAPKPWQNKQQQQQVPPWVRRDEPTTPPNQNGHQVNQSAVDTSNPNPIRIEVRSKQVPSTPPPPLQQQNRQQQIPFDPQQHPNAVFVTQPLVFQHPGPIIGPPTQQQQQQQRQSPNPMAGGTRIIPIMIERGGGGGGSSSPNPERGFQRQQSWNNNPTQSNSFKVIQKLTQTDNDDDNNGENSTVVAHPARYPQTFQQQSDGQENFLHNETDPRYRGAAIPSKAFKILQNMNNSTSGNGNNTAQQKVSGNCSPQPQVRTIPIQIEGNEQPQKYIHPSQQVTPEPKKYMGSSIPSRSFKMLQAMTAPDVCANTSVNVENVTTPNERWTYDHFIPPPPPPQYPFYPEYYYYPPTTNPTDDIETSNKESINNENLNENIYTPPYWPYYYTPQTNNDNNINNTNQTNCWPMYNSGDNNNQQQNYLPYCDPYYYYYYYYYYYGYPPQMYPTIYSNSDIDDINGYSSTDEMLYYTKQYNNNNNNNNKIVPQEQNNENKDCKYVPENESDRNDDTDTIVEDNDDDSSDENETETEENNKRKTNINNLQSLASVTDIKIYDEISEEQNDNAEDDDDEDDDDDASDTTTIEKEKSTQLNGDQVAINDDDDDDDEESIYSVEADTVPHQLSVILEETEHSSVCNDDENTTITDSSTESSDNESDEEEISVSVSLKLPYNIVQENTNCDDSDPNNDNSVVQYATFTINNIPSTKLPQNNESKAEQSKSEESEEPNNELQIQNEKSKTSSIVADDDSRIRNNNEESSDSDESSDGNEENWWSIVKDEPIQQEQITYKKFTKEENNDSNQSKIIEKQTEKNDINNNNDKKKEVELMSIKDRIKALKESIEIKEKQLKEKQTLKSKTKPAPIKIEVKPEKQPSDDEEENDSGVTSDVSRQNISDCEDFQELQKFNKYQRAATHSRLFQLLQQEICENEENDDNDVVEQIVEMEEKMPQDKFSKLSVRQNRQHLSLPLKNINEPIKQIETSSSPIINDKLVNELIVSLLHSKKGQIFRNMSKDKLKCTAIRVLQEDLDELETPSSSSGYNSLLSPPRGSTECSSPAQTPQDFYDNTSYSDYYDTWNEQQQQQQQNYDNNHHDEHLIPSKAFKIIQEQIINNNNNNYTDKTTKTKSSPKCPRVSKNIKKFDNTKSSPLNQKQSFIPGVAEVTNNK